MHYSKENKKNFVKKDTNLPSRNHSYPVFVRVPVLKVTAYLLEYIQSILIHIPLSWDPVVAGCAWLLN